MEYYCVYKNFSFKNFLLLFGIDEENIFQILNIFTDIKMLKLHARVNF